MSALHDRQGSLQQRDQEKSVTREIVRLGVTYQLCSRETSFVAVEQRERPVQGQLELRKIPVALTQGWGAMDPRLDMASSAFGAPAQYQAVGAVASAFDMLGESDDSLEEPGFLDSGGGGTENFLRPASVSNTQSWIPSRFRRRHLKNRPVEASKQRLAGLDQLVRLQGADGSWNLTDELAEILGVDLAQLERAIVGATGERQLVRQAWATALALAWLEDRAADSKEEWQLLGGKAERWLKQCPARLEADREWGEVARRSLQIHPPAGLDHSDEKL